jgi:hypothetical protein
MARALLVAIALTVTASPALADRSYPCWIVRAYVATHTKAQIEAAARKHKVTPQERAAHQACLKDNK